MKSAIRSKCGPKQTVCTRYTDIFAKIIIRASVVTVVSAREFRLSQYIIMLCKFCVDQNECMIRGISYGPWSAKSKHRTKWNATIIGNEVCYNVKAKCIKRDCKNFCRGCRHPFHFSVGPRSNKHSSVIRISVGMLILEIIYTKNLIILNHSHWLRTWLAKLAGNSTRRSASGPRPRTTTLSPRTST